MLPTITIDVGTTSVKLCMFDAGGGLRSSARHATPTVMDAWGEIYDLPVLRQAITTFVRDLEPGLRSRVQRIAITGVGESGGLVHPDLSLASPMILWHDQRGSGRLDPLSPTERARIYRVTGLPVNANYGLSKVAWALDHAGAAAKGTQWLNIAEYLAALMTGIRWSEFTLASRTMALDVEHGTWSAEIGALLGVSAEYFPQLRTATEGVAVSPAFARQTGLGADVHVHVAGHDHMVGAIGADLQPGELLNSTGTTEGLLLLQDAPSVDAQAERSMLANGISCTGSDFTLFASIPTGGSAFATLQTLLGLNPAQLTASIATVHARYLAGGIDLSSIPLVLPQFRGSPPPTKRALARGVMAGLNSDTSVEDIVFGCFAGMVLQFRDVLELFRARPERMKVIGPASKNPLWLQLKADLLDTPLSVSKFPEVVSRGAQAIASGLPGDWEACDPQDVLPHAGRSAQLSEWYGEIHPRWVYMKGMPE